MGRKFTEQEIDEARNLWRHARSFQDLCRLTVGFVEGRTPYLPTCGAPALDAESEGLIEHLAALNRAGFLTIMSQPGLDQPPWKQRACVDGFALEETVDRIMTINGLNDIRVLAAAPGETCWHTIPITSGPKGPTTWTGRLVFDNLNHLREDCLPEAMAELDHAWRVAVFDLVWGRNDVTWGTLTQALNP